MVLRWGAALALIGLAGCSVQLDRFKRRDARVDSHPADAPTADTPIAIDATVPGTWVQVPAGTFTMGSPTSEPCRSGDEDLHGVTLTHAFRIMHTEVTRQQFEEVLGYDPSQLKACGADCPVNNVTWHQAAAYCNALSGLVGLAPCYTCTGSGATISCSIAVQPYACPGYRLPTEAEWERAYRGGTTTAFPGGAVTSCSGPDPGLDPLGWYKENSGGTTHPVATRQPNAWGIHDMAGNVLEWINDRYVPSLGTAAVTDPVGASGGGTRVQRGGSYAFRAGLARAAARMSTNPNDHYDDFGFRAVRTE